MKQLIFEYIDSYYTPDLNVKKIILCILFIYLFFTNAFNVFKLLFLKIPT